MPSWLVRRATGADFAAVAKISAACGLDAEESGGDPRYVTHLIRRGMIALASDEQARPAGFAGVVQIGPTTMLTDLFVHPDRRGTGAGRALLAAVLPVSGPRMTFSSQDPRAVALYTQAGMVVRGALLYLSGDPAQVPVPDRYRSEAVAPAQAAAIELAITATDRSAEYEYWVGRPDGQALALYRDGAVVGVAAVGGGGAQFGVAHLACRADRDPADAVLTAVSSLAPSQRRALVCVPGGHPALRRLLGSGFAIETFDLIMASAAVTAAAGGPAGPAYGALAPGLC